MHLLYSQCRMAFVCFVLLALAVGAAPKERFLQAESVNAREILKGPFPDKSVDTQRELSFMFELQTTRTAPQEARCRSEVKWSPWLFRDVCGEWFTAENLPKTAELLAKVGRDTAAVCDAAKLLWNRPRPPLQDSRLHPATVLPSNGSYPSSHAAYGMVLASILADMAPDLRDALIRRGLEIGDDRVLAGVHFPSDVEAGRTLASAVMLKLRGNPRFLAALGEAGRELEMERAKHRPPASQQNP